MGSYITANTSSDFNELLRASSSVHSHYDRRCALSVRNITYIIRGEPLSQESLHSNRRHPRCSHIPPLADTLTSCTDSAGPRQGRRHHHTAIQHHRADNTPSIRDRRL
ncbi:hypothetical protein GDO81_000272 [Engystomops pustulosus]|uniref:Uncharacterized protein n=1 Tax=Engystomops pustulosus TaxID=76066 RepID=A0AAV7D6U7_ENGPU|nr:hypothetical protein GDO81_000272 [Engystomops pustulosus]